MNIHRKPLPKPHVLPILLRYSTDDDSDSNLVTLRHRAEQEQATVEFNNDAIGGSLSRWHDRSFYRWMD